MEKCLLNATFSLDNRRFNYSVQLRWYFVAVAGSIFREFGMHSLDMN